MGSVSESSCYDHEGEEPGSGVGDTKAALPSGFASFETIRKIVEARQFAQKLTDEVVSSYLIEPEQTRFGLINAFTNAAQKLGPLQRIEMERFCRDIVESSSTIVLFCDSSICFNKG